VTWFFSQVKHLWRCALAGEPVGLLEQAGGRWCIAYGPIELGIIDPKGRLYKPRL